MMSAMRIAARTPVALCFCSSWRNGSPQCGQLAAFADTSRPHAGHLISVLIFFSGFSQELAKRFEILSAQG